MIRQVTKRDGGHAVLEVYVRHVAAVDDLRSLGREQHLDLADVASGDGVL